MTTRFGIVRLESIRIKNFKNIANGEVYFQERNALKRGETPGDIDGGIIGIYGQNGSGKTSCLEALRIIQRLFSGASLFADMKNFISLNRNG